jgi:hypothetical protein
MRRDNKEKEKEARGGVRKRAHAAGHHVGGYARLVPIRVSGWEVSCESEGDGIGVVVRS